jgi:hypothetical protein
MSVEDLQEKVSLLEHELESERTAHDRDRQKLRKLEHLLLMAEKNKAARSRSVIVSGSLATIGIIATVAGTPLCFLQVMGVDSQGSIGYSLMAIFLGATLTLLPRCPPPSA